MTDFFPCKIKVINENNISKDSKLSIVSNSKAELFINSNTRQDQNHIYIGINEIEKRLIMPTNLAEIEREYRSFALFNPLTK